jgi:Bacterial capsule synthesis protein PGA_cap/TAT (twin-arginine translocation) pathway signal sequence
VAGRRNTPQGSGDGPDAEEFEPEYSRRDFLRAGLALSALTVAAGCGGGGHHQAGRQSQPSAAPPVSSPPTTSANSESAPVEPRGPLGSGQSVTFAFAGDTHFVDQWDTEGGANYAGVPVLADQLKADPTGVLSPIAPVLSRADLAMVNLETAITSRGEPVPGKAYHFRSPAESFVALRAAGVDVVNMANNHALDYGAVGMQDTFDAVAESGVPAVGMGHNAAEAFRPYRTVIHGQRIAIFGSVDWLEPALIPQWTATDTQPGLAFSIDPTPLLAAVRDVRSTVDTLIVFLHWGIETTYCASPEQHSLALALVGAGADIIVGSHAHRVFGAGHVGSSLVAYGLGNFVYFREDGQSGSSGVLLVKATGRQIDAYSWIPARIVHGIPRPETGNAAAADLSVWEQRRTCSALLP